MPTPRPHLIILFNDVNYKDIKKTIKDFSVEEVNSLLSCAQEFASIMDLNEYTLSLHTGYWVSLQKAFDFLQVLIFLLQLKASCSHFHAHICLELHKYIEIFWKTNYKMTLQNYKPTKNWEIIE